MTTDTNDTTRVPSFGDALPNGATVIAVRTVDRRPEAVVLAHADDEYVTWRMPLADHQATWAGHYFPYGPRRGGMAQHDALTAAVEDFQAR